MAPHLRIARPVTDLDCALRMYRDGLQLEVLGSFTDHDGFDGVMLGVRGSGWHLEFTVSRRHPVAPAPTEEDLLVLYLPEQESWRAACDRLVAAEFESVASFNPYWNVQGRTFVDPDGYRVVLQNARWGTAS